MQPFLLLDLDGSGPALAAPPTVGLAQGVDEPGPAAKDPDGFLSEREVYERGWRWCW